MILYYIILYYIILYFTIFYYNKPTCSMYGKYLPTKLCDVWGQMRVNVPYIYYIGVFHGSPKSWGYPSNHPVVLDDHDLVLKRLR